MKEKIAFLILLITITATALCQDTAAIKILKEKLLTAKEDTAKVNILRNLAFETEGFDAQAAARYAMEGYGLAQKLGYTKGIMSNGFRLASYYFTKTNFDSTVYYYTVSLNAAKKLKDVKMQGDAYNGLSWAYSELKQDYGEALKQNLAALKLAEENNDASLLAKANSGIAVSYANAGNFTDAAKYMKQAIAQFLEVKDSANYANNLGNLAQIYILDNKAVDAIAAYDKAIPILAAQGDFNRLGYMYNNRGTALANNGQLTPALQSQQTALGYAKKMDNKRYMASILQEIAKLYTLQKNYVAAITTLDSAYAISLQFDAPERQAILIGLLADNYTAVNDHKSAEGWLRKLLVIKDSIATQEKQKQLLSLQTQFETEGKEKQNQLLKAQNTLKEAEAAKQKQLKNIFIAGAALLLILALVLVNRYKIKQRAAIMLEEKNAVIEKEKQRAEKSEQFKSQFLANMSHEIRTPMNAVVGMTNLLIDEPQNEKNLRYLHAIKNASGNLLIIINDILDLSKMEAGKMQVEKVPFRFADIVSNVYDNFYLRTEEKNIRFIIDADKNIPDFLIGDQARLIQILVNIVGNAVKFTDKGSVIVRFRKAGTGNENNILNILFSVEDTGIGITKEKLETVFESFAQAHINEVRNYGGTGLGLTISKNLVELCGGKLYAESEPGAGSLFSFTLQFETATEQQFQEYYLQKDGYSADDLFGLKILLAEDNEDNQIVAADTLKKLIEEVEIDIVNNGKQVIEQLQNNTTSYDLILMDIQMPEMDGFETTKYIRNNFLSPAKVIPIIALTASVIRSDLQKCIDAGMNSYIPKPFTKEDLIKEIGKVLQRNTFHKPSLQNKPSVAGDLLPVKSNGIDFKKLTESSGNDKQKLKEYLLQFQKLIPVKLQQLQKAVSENNREEIYQSAHRIKPQLSFFGMKQEEHIANIIEIKAAEIAADELSILTYQLETACNAALNDIENKLKSLEE